jgi:RNA polymerase sigma-70 factor (ECF subfamily)
MRNPVGIVYIRTDTSRFHQEQDVEGVSFRIAEALISAERGISLDDADAFGHLYAQTHLIVFRYIYGLHGGPQEDVEDLTAETFVRAWRTRTRFEGSDDDALRWLLQIARHLVIDSHRRSSRRGIPGDIDELSIASGAGSPEEHTLANEQRRLLSTMLHTLTDRQREILILRYILGWRVKNIASYLDMTPNTVSVTIRRTLDRLRREWPEQEDSSLESWWDDGSLLSTWVAGRLMNGYRR